MNNPHNPDELSRALHELAQGIENTPLPVDDDAFATSIRLHTKAVRRRRRAQHITVAAACLALVAVGGVVVAQNLPGTGTNAPIAAQTDAPEPQFPQCGAKVAISTTDHGLELANLNTDANGRPATTSKTPTITGDDLALALEVQNNGNRTTEIQSTGYAQLIYTKDGRVLAEPGAMPEPATTMKIAPGKSEILKTTTPIPCGGTELPGGEYQVYAVLDAQITNVKNDNATTKITGGPWAVQVEPTTTSQPLQCGDNAYDTTRPATWAVPDFDLPADNVIDGTGKSGRDIKFRVTNGDVNTHQPTVRAVTTYLVSNEKVIAVGSAPVPLDREFKPGQSSDPTPIQIPQTRCDTGEPIATGEYEILINAPVTTNTEVNDRVLLGTGTFTLIASGDELPPTDPDNAGIEFPQCGAVVPQEDDSTLAIITTKPITRLPHGEDVLQVPAEITNITKDRLLGNRPTHIEAFLVKDGRIVTSAPKGTKDVELFDLAAGASATVPLRIGLTPCPDPGDAGAADPGTEPGTPNTWGPDAPAAPLPAGDYEVWAVTTLHLKERQLADGTSQSTSDVVPAIVKLTKEPIPLK